MLLLADLDPKFLAWLREKQYVNGLGPRSWVIVGKKVVAPGWFHLPTPGLTAIFEQHDLDHLLGGTLKDCEDSDARMLAGMEQKANLSWFLPAIAIEAAIPVARDVCKKYSWLHFRARLAGRRTERELMVDLHYPTPTN